MYGESVTEEFKRQQKWAGVLIQIDEEILECFICGEPVESYKEGLGLRLKCSNNHEVRFFVVNENT